MAKWWKVGVLLWAVAGSAQAQEIRCNQVFMNPSEKAICASPELLAIDAQMAQAYREAQPHLDGLRKDQRAFKRERKACRGDAACLLRVYEEQIAELRSAVPVAEEVADPVLDDALATGSEEPAPGILAEVANQEAPITSEPPPVAAPVAPPSSGSVPTSRPSDGSSWVVLAVIVFVVISAIATFVSWLFKAVDRCPKCTRWWAGQETHREEQIGTAYETVDRVDKHRSGGKIIKEVTRKEQVAYNVVRAAVRLECKYCRHEWFRHDSRRM